MPTALEIAQFHVEHARLKAPASAFPLVRAFVAELRAAGLEPKLTYACEGGLTVGAPDPREWVRFSFPHRGAQGKRG
jgi:hypothetical protein